MILDKQIIYQILKLQSQDSYASQARIQNVNAFYSGWWHVTKRMLDSKYDHDRICVALNRRTGKTTNKIIEAIIAEYSGESVAFIVDFETTSIWIYKIFEKYRNIIIDHFGDPKPYGGNITILSEYKWRMNRGRRFDTIISDRDL